MFSENWIEKTESIANPNIDFYFLISVTGEEEISTVDAINKIPELIGAYQAVISNSSSRGRDFNEIEHEFWVRPQIRDSLGATRHSFQWYDHLEESFRFLEWLENPNGEHEFVDLDQGWGFAARKGEDVVHMLEFDPDSSLELEHTFIQYSELLELYKDAYNRAKGVVAKLSLAIGDDVWSKYRGYEWDKVEFGTSDWSPR